MLHLPATTENSNQAVKVNRAWGLSHKEQYLTALGKTN